MAEAARIALVGGESLLGADLREAIATRVPNAKVVLVGSDEASIITQRGDEPVVITGLDEEVLAGARLVTLAGSVVSARKAWSILQRQKNPAPILDATGALEDLPESRLRAPLAEPRQFKAPASLVSVLAHPAAIVITTLVLALERVSTVARVVAHVFVPASELGRPGVEELHKQMIGLLQFKRPEQTVFGAQVGFNLLAGYGAGVEANLQKIEQRVEGHAASLLAAAQAATQPSVRLVQAPVMHGHSFSVWVEFEGLASAAAIEEALKLAGVDVREAGALPDVVGMAGEDGIAAGPVEVDRNNPRAAWVWAVSDNFRIASANAAALAGQIVGQ